MLTRKKSPIGSLVPSVVLIVFLVVLVVAWSIGLFGRANLDATLPALIIGLSILGASLLHVALSALLVEWKELNQTEKILGSAEMLTASSRRHLAEIKQLRAATRQGQKQ